MEVKIKRMNDAFHFEAVGESGIKVQIDSSPEIGGEGNGARPMELLLMAAGACSSIDVGMILKKQRQVLKDFNLTVSGERKQDDSKAFLSINLNFDLWGEIDPLKAEKAIQLAIKKYCSVILSLDKTITVTHSFKIHPII